MSTQIRRDLGGAPHQVSHPVLGLGAPAIFLVLASALALMSIFLAPGISPSGVQYLEAVVGP